MKDLTFDKTIILNKNLFIPDKTITVEMSHQLTDMMSYWLSKPHILGYFNKIYVQEDNIFTQGQYLIPSFYNTIEIIGEVKISVDYITNGSLQYTIGTQSYSIGTSNSETTPFRFVIKNENADLNPQSYFQNFSTPIIYKLETLSTNPTIVKSSKLYQQIYGYWE